MGSQTITCLLLHLTFTFMQAQNDDLVKTLAHGGKVRGKQETVQLHDRTVDISVYRKIPFAKPPVGNKRFAPPEAHEGWGGEPLDATRPPPACWQYVVFEGFDQNNPGARMWLNNTEMNEDCLYLNVWAPLNSGMSRSFPVMVWIYGGGYTSGTSTLDVYDASILVAKHEVVVMSMQYRVGAFGFLRLAPSSDGSNVAMGNAGLLDQLLALKWMKENIKVFGGDPSQVTVFGESSGAVSASLQWLSPLAKNYFNRVILQSASALTRWAVESLEEAHMRAEKFAVDCGCPSPRTKRALSLTCLQGLEPIKIVDMLSGVGEFVADRRMEKLRALFPGDPDVLSWAKSSWIYFDVPFKAVIDGHMIPKHPEEMLTAAFQEQLRNTREVLLGFNKNEAMYFLLYGLDLKQGGFLNKDGTVNLPEAIKKAAKGVPIDGKKADFSKITAAQFLSESMLVESVFRLPAEYYKLPKVTSEIGDSPITPEELMRRLDELCGELDFTCPTLKFAKRVASLPNSKVFLYELQRRTANFSFPKWVGVMHGYEIEYVFGMPYSEKFQTSFYRFNDEERKLSEEVMLRWTNFAKTGNPNLDDAGQQDGVQWPRFKAQTESDDYELLILDIPTRTERNLHKAGCRFWDDEIPGIVEKGLAKESNGCGQRHRIKTSLQLTVHIFNFILFNGFGYMLVGE
ncbi:Acetylcholinesterase [Clonorchis sinensis]|uniref:Carboxylic ester hydrolase n=1 Tax=Clonorchis sinensis TaxID=79923 RepID=A0A3R7F116_CLOSI|nr:Acetylcholinesterase [Clonorchis sinensis]